MQQGSLLWLGRTSRPSFYRDETISAVSCVQQLPPASVGDRPECPQRLHGAVRIYLPVGQRETNPLSRTERVELHERLEALVVGSDPRRY